MKKILSFTIACMSIIAGHAQTGSWSGELNVMGQKLPLVFNFSDKGCTMDSPKQGAKGIKTEWTPSDNGEVVIAIPMIGASYEGKMNGQEISGNFKQSGMPFPLTLTQAEIEKPKRPQTPVAPFPYKTEEVTFKDGEVELHGTLTLPENYTKNTPAVVMVTGSGQQNRDEELFDHKPFAVIADALARKGIATLRYDDRFWGNKDEIFVNYTTYHLKHDALAAIKLLRERFINVGILGHSEGGTIALLLAEEGKADFIVSLAGMVGNGKECLLKQNSVLLSKVGVPSDQVRAFCDALSNGFDQLIAGKAANEIAAPSNLDALLATKFNAAMKQASNPWFLYFLQLDPSKELHKIKCPVLALNGKLDTQVDCELNLELLEKNLKTKSKKIMALDNLNHLFQNCKTGLVTEYGGIEETISSNVLDTISAWINVINK
ncbi:MAG: alpha/beta hydrolase [Prevotellaceae bacterium]|nr:alpha/beta hydrolase [Prevotellaceae bacterium]